MAATAEVIAVELPGEGFAWNRRPLIRLGGEGDLEWSTIVGEVKLRTAKACVFCRHKFSGGPAAIRSHLLGEMKPILVKTCGTVQDHGIKAGRTGTKRFLRFCCAAYLVKHTAMLNVPVFFVCATVSFLRWWQSCASVRQLRLWSLSKISRTRRPSSQVGQPRSPHSKRRQPKRFASSRRRKSRTRGARRWPLRRCLCASRTSLTSATPLSSPRSKYTGAHVPTCMFFEYIHVACLSLSIE